MMHSTKRTCLTENLPIPHPKHNCRSKMGMMLNVMPITYVFEMNKIIVTSRTSTPPPLAQAP